MPERDPGGWREPLGTASRAPSADEMVPDDPTAWWRANLGRAAAGPPVLGSAAIVALGYDRHLIVLDPTNGDRLWRSRLNAPGAASPLVDGDRIYAASGGRDGRLYAYTLRGKKLWEQRLAFVTAPLALSDSLVVAGTEVGQVMACATATGDVRWVQRLSQAARAGVVSATGGLLVATDDSVFRLDAATGQIRARAALPGTAVAAAALQGDTVIVTTADGHVLTFRSGDLTPLWSLDLGAPIFGGPAVARDSVFAVSVRGVLWRIPLSDPEQADGIPTGAAVRAAPSPVRHGVLIGTLGGEILLVRGDSVMPQVRVEGPIEQPVIVRAGTMYVVDGRGRLHAWR